MSSEWRYDDRTNAARWPEIRRGGLDRLRFFFVLQSLPLLRGLYSIYSIVCLFVYVLNHSLEQLIDWPMYSTKNKIKIEQMGQRPVCSTGNWDLGPSNQIVPVTPQKLENPATFFSTNFGSHTRYYE